MIIFQILYYPIALIKENGDIIWSNNKFNKLRLIKWQLENKILLV